MRAIREAMLESRQCPECGTGIQADSRFTTWCPACDWNVDPGGPEPKKGRLETLRRTLARRHGEKLLATMSTDTADEQRARRDVSGVLAYVIALLIHGVTGVLAVTGVWCVVSGWGSFLMVPGLFLLLLGWALRPRLNRLPKDEGTGVVLRRPEAPELFALIDEIAVASGTRGVDAVAVNAEVNASVRTYGLRGRLLTLGLPLWESLSPERRIALLGHELGHYSNGDTRRGLVLATAYHSLNLWLYYLSPTPNPTPIQAITNLAYVVPRFLILGVLMLLDTLTLRATQRSEYLADSAAARAGSTEAAVGLMDILLVTDSIDITLRREVNGRRLRGGGRTRGTEHDDLWVELAAHMDSIPEFEYERQRRVGALRGHAVDTTHPPTHLRRRRLLDAGPVAGVVAADGERTARIAAELAGARGTVAREVVRDGVGGV
ncbi:M48 family metalloprotease [Streptomyces turgidiscabies]|uniref:Peptidase, M48 family n=1 Tax=Streptomyces turgidiscabies (strain Car8) TaxID=698760 RepID=L7EWQ1_STRT8|nr:MULTISPECIES: M48 family metalloprotease [Streptomyces]ELP63467.1 peptidase, M48 family [Streptomyces turgidiscabies Car8]MDX3497857.1 M48 family metalloprotease [Streptomyces turgidiscabies]